MPRSERGLHADRRADEVVVEEVRHVPGRRLPAMCWTCRVRVWPLSTYVSVVVVVTRLRRPVRVDLRVERPVRQVDAANGVGERPPLERVRREPQPCRTTRGCRRAPGFANAGTAARFPGGTPASFPRTARAAPSRRTRSSAPGARGRTPRSRCSSGTGPAPSRAPAARRRRESRAAPRRDRARRLRRCAARRAGDSVPQNGQTSSALAGFQFASPPHAGQANFGCAASICPLVMRGPLRARRRSVARRVRAR